ncbi:protein-serine O-palmitoleoyltransferase porcupine [Ceratitis capitata]|uniref:protein-serine O-palmitoleoyltransferase porcupine n=1 Tax=Ceratitis capitata TaxID=7213 RepID=UPI0006187EF6|nr:protein-serine O-palmitoleoyltransferase porcupine [Ceratitis capitata]
MIIKFLAVIIREMSFYNYDEHDELMDYIEEDYETTYEEQGRTWKETYESCIVPSTLQIIWYMLILIGCSFVCRFGVAVCRRFHTKNDLLLHSITIASGCSMLMIAVGNKWLIIAFFVIMSYAVLHLVNLFDSIRQYIGVIVLLITISTQLCCEFIWKQQVDWQMIKGSLMVSNMKIISIAFEIGKLNSRNILIVPNIFSYFGYIFMPSNLLIGPWVPYSSYLQSLRPKAQLRLSLRWAIWCSLCSVLSLVFLNLSNCIVPLLFLSNQSFIWLSIFRNALSVRCSQYFVSFLSQASITAGGISLQRGEKPNKWLGPMITRPLNIEVPRSLSSAVKAWNIPMHLFLKEFIFSGVYERFNSHSVAILTTYFVSALLHGQYFKIYLVLFSLACFGFVEYKIRNKISVIFNACITSNGCRKPCHFKYCPSKGWRSDGAMFVRSYDA